MQRILASVLLWIVASCANPPAAGTSTPGATGVATPVLVLATRALSPTALPSPVPTTNFTPEPTCDPLREQYCITDSHFIFARPIRPPGNDRIDSGYAYGSTANGTRDPHHGVEFSNPSGTPVHAAGAGTVIFAGPDGEARYAPWGNFYGNLVVIEHPERLFTLYAHLSTIDVEAGQTVLAGEEIGEVGSTGGALGSHLHFEVRQGDVEDYFATRNPVLWLAPAKDANGISFGALMISVVDGSGNLVEQANFTIGHYPDPSQSPDKIHYVSAYSPELLNGEENAALGELPAGRYRIAAQVNGQIHERWVEVESGRLTQAVLVVS